MTRLGWRGLTLALMLCAGLALVGCEGDQGPVGIQGVQGPQGPAGPPGGTVSDVTYVGNQGQDCLHCHGTTVTGVRTTLHNQAFADLGDSQDDPYCLQCHTTGWDSPVNFGDTSITTYGPDVYGYDDYFGVDSVEASSRRASLANVQCESCHGPMGPEFNTHTPRVVFSTIVDGEITALCMPCHEGQLAEWETSGHGTVGGIDNADFTAEFGRTSCDYCHTSEGFIRTHDPSYADYDFGGQYSFIGCVTCHDPHVGEAGGGNPSQLRTTDAVEVLYLPAGVSPGDAEAPKMEGYGPGQTCAQCHHGRRDNASVQGMIDGGSSHFGPHHSPQMDMFVGAGCYEIAGMTYEHTSNHQTSDYLKENGGCVKCHMERRGLIHGELQDHSYHSFTPDVGNCLPCHELTDFNYDNVQTTIEGKLDQLAGLLGYTDWADFDANWDDDNASLETWQREAGYAGSFVANDGSKGVHNPNYANSLLDNAIQYCQDHEVQ